MSTALRPGKSGVFMARAMEMPPFSPPQVSTRTVPRPMPRRRRMRLSGVATLTSRATSTAGMSRAEAQRESARE